MATKQNKFKLIDRPTPSPMRTIGLGMAPNHSKIAAGLAAGTPGAGIGALIDWVKDSVNCPIFNMPTIEQVRWGMDGAQSDASVKKNFGAEIDLFGSGKDPQGIDYVETTMALAGETQTYMLACAIFFHVEPEPLCFTAFGNSWQPLGGPTTVQAAGNVPISPDVFTFNDFTNGALGSSTATGTFFGPAVMEHGWWANYAAWHMVRGYNMRWKIGQHTNILDEVLRHTAYMPTNAQEGSASNSEVDIVQFVNRMNNYYVVKGSAQQFLKVNRIRIGSVLGTAGTNVGIFRPSNDDILVGATYGGMDLRSLLKGNSEFRKLTLPYVIKPGVPIGLVAQANDTDQIDTMQAYLSLTQIGNQYGGGVFPPVVTDTPAATTPWDGTNATPVGLERTLDGFNVAQQVGTGRSVHKSGTLKISQGIKGFEVSEDWYTILQNNPDLKELVMGECSIRFAQQGAG